MGRHTYFPIFHSKQTSKQTNNNKRTNTQTHCDAMRKGHFSREIFVFLSVFFSVYCGCVRFVSHHVKYLVNQFRLSQSTAVATRCDARYGKWIKHGKERTRFEFGWNAKEELAMEIKVWAHITLRIQSNKLKSAMNTIIRPSIHPFHLAIVCVFMFLLAFDFQRTNEKGKRNGVCFYKSTVNKTLTFTREHPSFSIRLAIIFIQYRWINLFAR